MGYTLPGKTFPCATTSEQTKGLIAPIKEDDEGKQKIEKSIVIWVNIESVRTMPRTF